MNYLRLFWITIRYDGFIIVAFCIKTAHSSFTGSFFKINLYRTQCCSSAVHVMAAWIVSILKWNAALLFTGQALSLLQNSVKAQPMSQRSPLSAFLSRLSHLYLGLCLLFSPSPFKCCNFPPVNPPVRDWRLTRGSPAFWQTESVSELVSVSSILLGGRVGF